jgi:hypothetical protein
VARLGSTSPDFVTQTRSRAEPDTRRRLDGPIRAYILDGEKARGYAPFSTLRCGEQSDKAVREVELTARRLRAGAVKMTQTPVVLESGAGLLLGYCSVHAREAHYEDGHDRPWVAERYIVGFGRDARFAGFTLADGETKLGEAIVRAGLDMIAVEYAGRGLPRISALVRAENEASHRIFDGFGFGREDSETTGYTQDLRVREAELALPEPLDASAYVPPAAPGPDAGRNDPCWCGSARKLKRCHGA